MCLSQKFHVPKRISVGYAKKERREKKNVHAKRHERKKCMPKSMKKRKERNKDSPYFQIKGIYPKERESWSKWVQKYLELGTLWKISHTCTSWSKCMTCISLRFDFWLSKICDASMPHFHTYPKLHSKALVVGYQKEGKNIKSL